MSTLIANTRLKTPNSMFALFELDPSAGVRPGWVCHSNDCERHGRRACGQCHFVGAEESSAEEAMFAVVVVKDLEDVVAACAFFNVVSWVESSFFWIFWEHMFLPDIAIFLIRIRTARGIATKAGPSQYGLGLFFLF